MRRALVAWELGGGYGHVATVTPVARAFIRAGWSAVVAARRPAPFAAQGLEVRPAPRAAYAPGPFGAISLSAILLENGYGSPAALRSLVDGWRRVFAETRANLVCAEYAPTALLAARLAGLPAVAFGMGFYLPPQISPLPSLQPWREAPSAELAAADAAALATVNALLTEVGATPLARFADLWAAEARILCTWPELDHYEARSGEDYFGPLAPGGPAAAPSGSPRAFVYLRADDCRLRALFAAFARAGVGVTGHVRGASAAQLAGLAGPRIALSAERLDAASEIAASHFVVCNGGHGVVSQALRAGRPLLLLPSQAEQTALSVRLARRGLGLVVDPRRPAPDFAIPLRKLAAGACGPAAQALAERYAGHDPAALCARIVSAAGRLASVARHE